VGLRSALTFLRIYSYTSRDQTTILRLSSLSSIHYSDILLRFKPAILEVFER